MLHFPLIQIVGPSSPRLSSKLLVQLYQASQSIWIPTASCPMASPQGGTSTHTQLLIVFWPWWVIFACGKSAQNTCSFLSSVQSLSRVWLFATPWISARQASLSITNSQSLPKLMPIESVMPSSHLILCRPLLLLPPIPPSIRVFSNESTLRMRWPSIGVSASVSVLPMNTQDWSPLGWTGWISLQSKGLSGVFSNTTVQKHQFFNTLLLLNLFKAKSPAQEAWLSMLCALLLYLQSG